MKTAIHTMNLAGNLHSAARQINKLGLAEHLVTMEFNGGHHTIAVFKMPAEKVRQLRDANPAFCGDHDDLPLAPAPIDDESLAHRIGELGNQIHNLGCEHQNNEELAGRLAELAHRAWMLQRDVTREIGGSQ